jgi:glycosyltransferase involved in cell wall biosynthesis
MKVAVVQTEVIPEAGGRHTFQGTILDALGTFDGKSAHTFVHYAQGLTRSTPGSRLDLFRRAASYLANRGVRLLRDVQDRVLGVRVLHLRSAFERRLDADGIDLVWFIDPYADDCHLPYIFTVFDLEYLGQPWFPEVSGGGEWERRHLHYERYLRKATRVIVPNEAGREQVMDWFLVPHDRILILPHPVPQLPRTAGEQIDVPVRFGLRRPYLFYPAGYWPHKNHAGLLRALRQLNAESSVTFDLVCVGADKGNLAHVGAQVRELGLTKNVHLLGFVEPAELVALYRDAHALVYLSFFGPENLPPLEAYAIGCPVIAADIPGAREQLGEAAILVSPADAEQLATAVLELRDDSVRTRLVAAGHVRAEQRSAERFVAGVVEFLDGFEPIRACWP